MVKDAPILNSSFIDVFFKKKKLRNLSYLNGDPYFPPLTLIRPSCRPFLILADFSTIGHFRGKSSSYISISGINPFLSKLVSHFSEIN